VYPTVPWSSAIAARRRTLCLAALLIAAPAGAQLSGSVHTIDGEALRGASVRAQGLETSAERFSRWLGGEPRPIAGAPTTSAASGRFLLATPPAAGLDVTVKAEGYAPQRRRVEAPDVLQLALAPAPTLGGEVTAGGRPLPAATVVLVGIDGAEWVTRTDARGAWRAPDPSRWAVAELVFHPDFAPRLLRRAAPGAALPRRVELVAGGGLRIALVPGDGAALPPAGAKADVYVDALPFAAALGDGALEVAHVPPDYRELLVLSGAGAARLRRGETRAVLHPAARIHGQVVDATTGRPLRGVEVQLLDRDSDLERSLLTGDRGTFEIAAAAGRYTVTAMVPDHDVAPQVLSLARGEARALTLEAAALARIGGEAVDERGAPLPGVQVVARAEGGDPLRLDLRAMAYSAADGSFVLTHVPVATPLAIRALRRGFEPHGVAAGPLRGGERRQGVRLVLQRAPVVAGHVRDGAGRPLAGAEVTLRDLAETLPPQLRPLPAHTDRAGAFALTTPRGTYELVARAEGFAPRRLRPLAVAETGEPLELVLSRPAELRGRITRGGEPLAAVRISAEGGAARSTLSDRDGWFVLDGLEPGEVTVTFTSRTGTVHETRDARVPGELLVDLPAGTQLRGRVVDATDHRPVARFTVAITTGAGERHRVETPFDAADGGFTLDGVPDGMVELVVGAEGYATRRLEPFTVAATGATPDLEVELVGGGLVFGSVADPDGQPIAGASVRFLSQGSGGSELGGVSDRRGFFTVEGLPAGPAVVCAEGAGFAPREMAVEIAVGKHRLDLVLERGAELRGEVVGEDGGPLAGATVALQGSRTQATVRTDGAGHFVFTGLLRDAYGLVATRQGYVASPRRMVAVPAPEAISVQLRQGGALTGSVTGIAARDMRAVVVSAASAAGSDVARLAEDGSFRLESVPPGRVTVRAQLSAGGEVRQSLPVSVDVRAGSETRVDLAFSQDVVVSGQVRRGDEPLGGAQLVFRRGETHEVGGTALSGTAGDYQLPGLVPGDYLVEVHDASGRLLAQERHRIERSVVLDFLLP
jgi:hypothetical protein